MNLFDGKRTPPAISEAVADSIEEAKAERDFQEERRKILAADRKDRRRKLREWIEAKIAAGEEIKGLSGEAIRRIRDRI